MSVQDPQIPTEARWRSFVSQFGRRWRYVWRQALAQSLGVLVLTHGLLTIAAVCFRATYVATSSYYIAVERQLRATSAPGEPRPDLEYPAIAAAVLAPINTQLGHWTPDSLYAPDAKRAELILECFRNLSSYTLGVIADQRSKGRFTAHVIDSVSSVFVLELGRLAPRGEGQPWRASWAARVDQHFRTALQPDESYLTIASSEAVRDPSISTRTRLQGPVGIQFESEAQKAVSTTSLQVPSTMFADTVSANIGQPGWLDVCVCCDSVRQVWRRARGPHYHPQYPDHDILLAATISAFLEDAVALSENLYGSSDLGFPGRTPIVQAYFISARSVLRIWPRKQLTDLPLNRHWASAHYFTTFLDPGNEGKTRYETPPYIDVGGHGVVRTITRVIEAPSTGEAQGMFGVVGVDYQLPVDAYLAELAKQNIFFQLRQLRVPHGSSLADIGASTRANLTRARMTLGRKVVENSLWAPEVDDDLINRISRYAAKHSAREVNGGLGTLRSGREPEFLLPLASGVSGSDVFLILSPITPRLPMDAYLIGLIGVIASLGAIAMLLYWTRQADSQYERLGMATALRNLPVGVCEVDEDDIMIRANQAAEWLFDTTLIQWFEHDSNGDEQAGRGHPAQRQRRRGDRSIGNQREFGRLILRYVVLCEDGLDYNDPGSFLHRSPRVVPYSDITADRQNGRSSSYFAVVRETHRVVVVSGAPILESSDQMRPYVPRTSAVISPVGNALAEWVRKSVVHLEPRVP